jgi:ribosomal protein S18 acetylase RimI-like enzyme
VVVPLFAICHQDVVVQDDRVIRSAVPDDAPKAVPLILEAIGSIAFVLTGTTDRKEAGLILNQFFQQKGNRVSYENALVLEDSKDILGPIRNSLLGRNRDDLLERSREVVGIALIYDGAIARKLDEPLEKAAIQKSGLSNYRIPTEAELSEFYLDAISVDPECQGRGFGRDLIEASCEHARTLGRNRVGLLVDIENLGAKRLYERLEFRVEGSKQIGGEEYLHMVRDL